MAIVKKGLGRGLSALIPDGDMDFLSRVARGDSSVSAVQIRNAAGAQAETSTGGIEPTAPGGKLERAPAEVAPILIGISQIEANPYQPRRTFGDEEMQELVESVRTHGILQPILVRPLVPPHDGVLYQLVAGERRWRASQQAGLEQVPAIVRNVSDQQALELALIENIQRHDISPVDAAQAYKRLVGEFGLSQEAVALRVGKSRSSVANTLRLLDLPSEMQQAMEEGLLTEGHGRAILLAVGEGARRAVFRSILREKLSVRDAEQLARRCSREVTNGEVAVRESGVSRKAAHSSQELKEVEQQMQKLLGTRVHIRSRARGGQIVIQYFSDEDLSRITSFLLEGASPV